MSKARGCGFAFLATVLVCGVGGWAAVNFGGMGDRRGVEAELKRAVRLGLPADPTDAKTIWPAPRDPAKNAASYYTAFAKQKPNPISTANKEAGKMGYPQTPGEIRALEAVLRPAATEMARFEAAASLPECRFQRKAGIDTLFPEYSYMKEAVKLLAMRARLEAAKGDPLKAMRTLDSGARATAQVGQESILIAKLVQIADQAIVLRAAQEVLADYGRRADVRAAARKVLADLGPPPNMKDGMKGEWMFQRLAVRDIASGKMSMQEFGQLSSGGSEGSSPDLGAAVFALSMKTPAGRAKQELAVTRLFLDYYEGLPDDATEVKRARKASRDIDARLAGGGVELTLAKIIMPVFAQANDAAAKAVAERRAFAALLTTLDQPTIPKWLPAKGTESLDPFTGEPLCYQKKGDTIRIWSVGPDGMDDGGLLKETDGSSDVTVYWPRPKLTAKAGNNP